MNSFPIQEFQNDKELNDYLKEWQERISLIMAKYGLKPSWFINFEVK